MENFLSEVCSMSWNTEQDRGRSWKAAIQEAIARHPSQEAAIRAYDQRWEEMLDGAIEDNVALLEELQSQGIRLLALTNWSAEKFPIARERFPFLKHFEGILISGEEGLIKPDAAIFELLIQRYQLLPSQTVFIDDSLPNVHGGKRAGLQALHFTTPRKLRQDLATTGLPVAFSI